MSWNVTALTGRFGRACGVFVVLSAWFLNSAPAWADPDPDLTDPIPNAIEEKDVAALQGTPQPSGRLVRVNIPDTVSHFPRRPEYVYLPPAWFASKTPPHLPAVMMIAGQGDSPEYWARNGAAVQIASDFAANHGGNSPVLAFVDFGGFFNADTECVNGPRGNVEDHLTKEVPQYVNAKFDTTNWGVVGWSMGGTCAVTLAATHPELFSGFVDIVGYERPSLPDGEDTLGALFGGNKAAQDAHDTPAVIAQRRYSRTAGWFQVTGHPGRDNETKENSDADVWVDPDSTNAAKELCEAGRKAGMSCAVYVGPGRHLWPFARSTFSDSLPWLAGYLHTPGVPEIGLAPSDL